ncbi:MAG: Short-chain dehydrogenase/reductase [Pedosphaera sp.]|nr:Short-chain dehydrogenase/reductase [Pedosphaera sp.]
MRRRIAGSVVVITGASSGIARATALMIAEQRGSVVLASRQEKVLQEVAAECVERGGEALAVRTDVTDERQVQELSRRAVERFGRIDVWVNAAAVALYAKFEEAPADTFRRVIETNLFGYIHGARVALPIFRRQGQGMLINIASVFGKVGAPYVSAYATSKFAVTGFSESLRAELRDEPEIHVCTILPATIDTPIFQHAANFTGRALQALPPVYRPEKVARAIVSCILNPKREVNVGAAAKQVAMLQKFSTPLAERVVAAKVERQHFKRQATGAFPGNMFISMPQYNRVSGGWLKAQRRSRSRLMVVAALLTVAGVAAYYVRFNRRQAA